MNGIVRQNKHLTVREQIPIDPKENLEEKFEKSWILKSDKTLAISLNQTASRGTLL